jgi:hypothetical protein
LELIDLGGEATLPTPYERHVQKDCKEDQSVGSEEISEVIHNPNANGKRRVSSREQKKESSAYLWGIFRSDSLRSESRCKVSAFFE